MRAKKAKRESGVKGERRRKTNEETGKRTWVTNTRSRIVQARTRHGRGTHKHTRARDAAVPHRRTYAGRERMGGLEKATPRADGEVLESDKARWLR